MKNTTALILVLIAAALFYTFISPQWAKTQVLSTEADQYKNILQNVGELSDTSEDLLAKARTLPSESVNELTRILPDNVDTVRLALDLDTVASNYGIAIQSVKVNDKKDANTGVVKQASSLPYESIGMSFTFISTYENFRKFMGDIERSQRVSDVRAISFRSTESGLYEFTVSIDTYWLK